MTARKKSRTVYSTDGGRTCPACGWPVADCRCSAKLEQAVPDRIVARLRISKAGRRGKTVTMVEGLPRNAEFLKALAKELKGACGSGGTAGRDHVEVQGDHLETLRGLLRRKGWTVKG
jgi:translation initiation factor 1